MNIMVLLRIARMARNPLSDRSAFLLYGLIAVVLLIAGIEYFIGWPEWAQMEPRRRIGF